MLQGEKRLRVRSDDEGRSPFRWSALRCVFRGGLSAIALSLILSSSAGARDFFGPPEQLQLSVGAGSSFFLTSLSVYRYFREVENQANPFRPRDDGSDDSGKGGESPESKMSLAWSAAYQLSDVRSSWGHQFALGLAWRPESGFQLEIGAAYQTYPSLDFRRGSVETFWGYAAGKARVGLQFDFYRDTRIASGTQPESQLNEVAWGPQLEWRFNEKAHIVLSGTFHRYTVEVDPFLSGLGGGSAIKGSVMSLGGLDGGPQSPGLFYFPNLVFKEGLRYALDDRWSMSCILTQATYTTSVERFTLGLNPWVLRRLDARWRLGGGVELTLGGTETVFAGVIGLSHSL